MADHDTTDPTPEVPDDSGAAEAATEPTDVVAPASTAEPAPPSGLRRRVGVPVWALGLVAVLLVGLLGFGIGRWTAPDDDDEVSGIFQGQVEPDDDGGPQTTPDFPTGDRVILGVQAADSTDPEGAELVEVLAIGPAGEAGLEVGDVVTAVDDEDISDADDLAEAVQSREAGDEVTITYERDGETDEVDVTLERFSEIEPRPSGGRA